MVAETDYCGVGPLVLPIQNLASDRPQGWGEPPGAWRTSWLSWAPRGTPDFQGPFLPSSIWMAGIMPMTSGSTLTTPTSTLRAGAPRQGIPCSLLSDRENPALPPLGAVPFSAIGACRTLGPPSTAFTTGSAPLLVVTALATSQASSQLTIASQAAPWPRGTRAG